MIKEVEESRSALRPAVSVLVPFAGDREAASRTLAQLQALELGPDDELIVSDNSRDAAFAAAAGARGRVRVVRAEGERSSYHARNVAAGSARHDWLLFIDSDCRPPNDLLERYFAYRPGGGCGALAGGVKGEPGQSALVARWSRARSVLESEELSKSYERPWGPTANLLVRRAAWESVGGFQEGIRSSGDVEFCWRLQDAGWELMQAPEAAVEHRDRETVRALARVSARYGAGAAWLNHHRPGSAPRPRPVRELARCALGAAWYGLTGRWERARFMFLDMVAVAGVTAGYLRSNRPLTDEEQLGNAGPSVQPPTAILCDSFPVMTETFIAAEAQALVALGTPVRVEAVLRAERPNRAAARGLPVAYIEDESYLGRVGALLALVGRHPLRAARDLAGSRRWPAEERVPLASLAPMVRRLEAWGARHLHAHFATSAAVSAARVGRLLGISHSVTAHAYEIFGPPQPLAAKLESASFVTTGCEYNRDYLRAHVLGESPPVHEIVMGVDAERFKRNGPYPGGRTVLAVGRLVEKKGFNDLIEAVALLEREHPLEAVVIVGEGPLRVQLEKLVGERGLGHRVSLPGALDPVNVRAELERADLLAMPSVVAADGDRDSMPVVVKEALAMEVPVVATDEVGLPELVKPEFGRLVPPADPDSLASAIAEVLSLPAEERMEMGRLGRAWVSEHASVEVETRKLLGLITAASDDERSAADAPPDQSHEADKVAGDIGQGHER